MRWIVQVAFDFNGTGAKTLLEFSPFTPMMVEEIWHLMSEIKVTQWNSRPQTFKCCMIVILALIALRHKKSVIIICGINNTDVLDALCEKITSEAPKVGARLKGIMYHLRLETTVNMYKMGMTGNSDAVDDFIKDMKKTHPAVLMAAANSVQIKNIDDAFKRATKDDKSNKLDKKNLHIIIDENHSLFSCDDKKNLSKFLMDFVYKKNPQTGKR